MAHATPLRRRLVDSMESETVEERLARRDRQQAAVAGFGKAILDDGARFKECVAYVASGLARSDRIELLRLLPGGRDMETVATTVRDGDCPGHLRIRRGCDSLAGYCLEKREPVFARSLDGEVGFLDAVLRNEGMASGIVVPVGRGDRLWGVLGAYSRSAAAFNAGDKSFVQAIANFLALTVAPAGVDRTKRRYERELRTLAESVPVLVVYLDREHRFQFNNAEYARWFAPRSRKLRGRHFRDVFGSELYQAARPYLDKALAGKKVTYEDAYPAADGGRRWVLVTYVPARDGAGNVRGLYGVIVDITRQKRVEFDLRERSEHLRLALEAGQMGTWAWDAPDRISWDDRERDLFGIDPDTTVTDTVFWSRVHREDRERLRRRFAEAIEQGGSYDEEFRILRGDGRTRWLAGRGLVLGEAERKRMVGINFDITARKESEERFNGLVAELDHRVKNVLANICAVVQQTKTTAISVPAFLDSVEGRVQALSRAHMLISESGWKGIEFRKIVERQLVPYLGALIRRVRVDGSAVMVRPDVAQSVSLAIHELASNAAKYGALSSQDGRIEISWQLCGRTRRPELQFVWRERQGPSVEPPAREGFGSKIIKRSLPYDANAIVELLFESQGVICMIRFPTDAVMIPSEASAAERARPN